MAVLNERPTNILRPRRRLVSDRDDGGAGIREVWVMKADLEKRGQTMLLMSLYVHSIYPRSDWANKILGPMAVTLFVVMTVGWLLMLSRAARSER